MLAPPCSDGSYLRINRKGPSCCFCLPDQLSGLSRPDRSRPRFKHQNPRFNRRSTSSASLLSCWLLRQSKRRKSKAQKNAVCDFHVGNLPIIEECHRILPHFCRVLGIVRSWKRVYAPRDSAYSAYNVRHRCCPPNGLRLSGRAFQRSAPPLQPRVSPLRGASVYYRSGFRRI